jgi:hypothetical protein
LTNSKELDKIILGLCINKENAAYITHLIVTLGKGAS